MSVVDMSAEMAEHGSASVGRVLRTIRLFRVVRGLRLARVQGHAREFQKLMFSLATSLRTIFWSMLRHFMAPGAVCLIVCSIWLKRRFRNSHLDFKTECVNTRGACMKILSMFIVLSCVMPMVCYEHPGDYGDFSVLSNPSVLSYEDDTHVGMMIVGALAFVIVALPFFGTVAYAAHSGTRSSLLTFM